LTIRYAVWTQYRIVTDRRMATSYTALLTVSRLEASLSLG